MDADPLYNVKQLFYQGSFKAAIDEATSQGVTPGGDESSLLRAVYVARSHLALNPPAIPAAQEVLAPWLSSEASPAARAAGALATYLSSGGGVDEARDLVLEVEDGGDEEGVVRALVGTIFILEKEVEEAVATLSEGGGAADLECIALLVQLCLSLNRRDLAQGQYAIAKKIGNDSILVQAIEAWIGLKTGSRPLHQAYYFYEELYQLPNGRTPPVLAAHAAAHRLLGHDDEAKADISEAMQGSGASDPAVLAVATTLGDNEAESKLASTKHPLALDLAASESAFDEAAAKFAIAA